MGRLTQAHAPEFERIRLAARAAQAAMPAEAEFAALLSAAGWSVWPQPTAC